MAFSNEDKILIKNLQQLKGYTATRFLRELRRKTGQQTNSDNSETNCYTNFIILLNKPYFGLLYAN